MTTTKNTPQKARLLMIEQYILNCISSEGYDITAETPAEKVKFLIDTYLAEYEYTENLRYYGNRQNCFKNWCMGLPSAFNIDFENYRIIELGVKWGLLAANASEVKQDKFIERYWNGLYMSVRKLAKKHKIEF